MERHPSTSTPRVSLARESLWMVPVPSQPSERLVLQERRGTLVTSAYAIYSDALEVRDFDAYVLPVLRTMAASRSRSVLTLLESPATFDAGRTRYALQSASELGLTSMVEISGTWRPTLLELLAAAGPAYVRLAPEFVHGVGSVPDVFRQIVTLAEFARERGFEIVARNPRDGHELDAVRVAGVGLMQWLSVPLLPEQDAPSARAVLEN